MKGRGMGKGLYRDPHGWVMVDYGNHRGPIPKSQYKANGYQPPYEQLPTEVQYNASKKAYK